MFRHGGLRGESMEITMMWVTIAGSVVAGLAYVKRRRRRIAKTSQ